MNQNEVLSGLITNAILMTAQLANEVCIQTKGEFLVPETDYLHLVKEFQYRIAKRIMPIQTQDDLKEEARKYILEIIEASRKGEQDANNDSGKSESGSVSDSE